MTLRPNSIEELARDLRQAGLAKQKITAIDLRSLACLVEHTAEDLTVTAQAGMTVAELQERLRGQRQWLPIDPPQTTTVTLRDLLDFDLSGPRRYGFGTVREHLLGLQVVLADGRIIRNGGRVVKNVAGFDLCKLFVGAQGTLGAIVEVTFKVQPLPEEERFVALTARTLHQAAAAIEGVIGSALAPVVLDWVQLPESSGESQVVLGFAGTKEDVAWQLELAGQVGFTAEATLDYAEHFAGRGPDFRRASVLPSRLPEVLRDVAAAEFVVRAGNGQIFYRGGRPLPLPPLSRELMQRVKETYDPLRVLPELVVD